MKYESNEVNETLEVELNKEKKPRRMNPIAKTIVLVTIFSLVTIVGIILILMAIELIDLEKIFLGVKK